MPQYPHGKQKIIDDLQRDLDEIERTWPMINSYKRREPYIVPALLGNHYFEVIIYHEESRQWFDKVGPDFIMDRIHERHCIQPGDVVFDLGSNAGVITLLMASMAGESGRVHAFDPFPWNAAATKHNARLNYLSNVIAHPVGLSNRRYTINVDPYESRIYEASTQVGAQTLSIESIGEYMHLKPAFIKIDIEGSEYELFADLPASMFESVRMFVLEYHPFMIRPRGLDPRDGLRNMESAGFTLHYYIDEYPVYNIEAFNDAHHLFWGKRKS
jgi:FkbM family methyltransferase